MGSDMGSNTCSDIGSNKAQL